MKKLLNHWLNQLSVTEDTGVSQPSADQAKAAILLAVVEADHSVEEAEHQLVMALLQQRLGLSLEDAGALLEDARSALADSVSLHDFISALKAELSAAQRRELMHDLWQVAFADGHLDAQEEHLLRRISDLLSIPHSVFIQAKLKSI